jgi:hypothetical protein
MAPISKARSGSISPFPKPSANDSYLAQSGPGRPTSDGGDADESRGRDRLAFYPFVVVRIASRICSRSGSYPLARLAAKYGPEINLRDLTDRQVLYDSLWQSEARSKKGKSACGVTCPTLSIGVRPISGRA